MNWVLKLLTVPLICAIGMVASANAVAQTYPTQPIKIIVGNTPGSLPDLIARAVATGMQENLGQAVIVENRPGADQLIGYLATAQAPADGYTLVLGSPSQLAALPILLTDIKFDPLKDLPAVIGLVEGRYGFMVPATTDWKSLKDLIAAAKSSPGNFNFGAATVPTRLLAEFILRKENLNVVYVPYKGTTEYLTAIMRSEVHMGVTGESGIIPLKDKIRVLAVSGRRSPSFPDAPTFAEQGYPEIPTFSFSLNMRKETPNAIRQRIFDAASKVLRQPDVVQRFNAMQLDVVQDMSPAHAESELARLAKLFSELAKLAGVEPK